MKNINITNIKLFLFTLATGIFLFNTDAKAQFYTGLYNKFGKNRVQYNKFTWSYYRFEKFDTYFIPGGKPLAVYTAERAKKYIKELELFFDYHLDKRIIFVIYNRQSDFKQSNIGLKNGEEQNIGGVTRIIDNKVFLYYEDSRLKYEKQIKKAVAEILFYNMLYGGNFKDRIAASAMLNLPKWFTEGLTSYLTEKWSFEIEDEVKNGIQSGEYKKINWLQAEDAKYAGHSIWRFIAKTYGESVIRNIVYLTKINRDYERGLSFVIGTSFKDLVPDWIDYYKNIYSANDKQNSVPDSLALKLSKRKKRLRKHKQIKISPTEEYIAYTTNQKGKYIVWLYDVRKRKHLKLMKRGHKLDQIADYSYPILAWHPTGSVLAILTEHQGIIKLNNYYVNTRKMDSRAVSERNKAGDVNLRRLFFFEKVIDLSYSRDGMKLAMSAVKEGQTDIFVFNLTSNSSEQLTNDIADDHSPRFTDKDERIIFSSNRKTTELIKGDKNKNNVGKTFDLFAYNYKNRSKKLNRLTETPYSSEFSPITLKNNEYAYLSDKNGIFNRYTAKFDSTISHIDTITHYRFFTKNKPVTNYDRNIKSLDLSFRTGAIAEIFKKGDKEYLYFNPLIETERKISENELPKTEYKKEYEKSFEIKHNKRIKESEQKKQRLKRIDSLKIEHKKQLEKEQIEAEQNKQKAKHSDSILIDINNYIFEKEKKQFRIKNSSKLANYIKILEEKEKKDSLIIPKQRLYFTNFYTNYLVSRLDYSFLNNSYQTFTNGPVFFSPGGNLLMKMEAYDLFEDYRIAGGFRFAGDFNSYEFLLSLEDLKYRTDKQYIFHRQSYLTLDETNSSIQVITNEGFYTLRYPFSQVSALKGTANLRLDYLVSKSENSYSLKKENEYKSWGSLKVEYIFDNTFNLGLNLYQGTRFKIFSEFYKRLDKRKSDLFVFGLDFRNYIRIHRNFIWANRFAASTSPGHSKLLYYLGAVDNWMRSSRYIFDKSVPVTKREQYAFQTVATNMRGFRQNIRNGNSFALINSELRLPLFNYLLNRPIDSDFFNNFQLVGFFDIGSAWTGKSPNDKINEYNKIVKESGSVTVIIDRDKPPYVLGYGWGLRSRLLGYFIRLDWAWGVEGDTILPREFYLSLSMDF